MIFFTILHGLDLLDKSKILSLGGSRAEERMDGETSHCPSETCDARNPPKTREIDILCLSMDEELDEFGDDLENLENDVEFVSYAESCETFRRI